MKILVAVDSEDKIPMSLTAAEHLSEMPEAEIVEMVYLNGGIAAVVEKNRIKPLLENKKVKVVACGTSMEARNITKDELAPGVVYVPASLKEIISRVQEGYIYLTLRRALESKVWLVLQVSEVERNWSTTKFIAFLIG